jgi:aryl sulfotransferase
MVDRAQIRYRGEVYDSDRWRGFRLRHDDIVISTPPKCGTTWTQMICALLVLQRTELDTPLSTLSPWLDMRTRSRREVMADLEAQTHRRFIKTHTPLDGLPVDPSVTYICVGRDPRDVAISMDGHRDNMDVEAFRAAIREAAAIDGIDVEVGSPLPARPDGARERFWHWVDDDTPPAASSSSLLRTLRHFEGFWEVRDEPNIVLLHYDDLQADLEGQMRAVASRLGIQVAEDLWPDLVAAAGFAAMRDRADRLAPRSGERSFWRDEDRFFRRGSSGQWRSLLDADDLRRYERRVAALVAPEVAAWAHGADWSTSVRRDRRV